MNSKRTNPDLTTEPSDRGRREFLRNATGAAAAVTFGGIGSAFTGGKGGAPSNDASGAPSPLPATDVPTTHTLVYINLRGGADGLTFLAPVGDDHYTTARPTLGYDDVAPYVSSSLFGSSYWKLSPALESLRDAWDDDRLALIPAVGQPGNNKSHFIAMDRLEFGVVPVNGTVGALSSGFLSRVLNSSTAQVGSPLRGLAIQPVLPTGFLSAPRSIAASDPPTYDFNGDAGMRIALDAMNAERRQVVEQAHSDSLAAVDRLNAIPFSTGSRGYPEGSPGILTALGKKFREAEDMIVSGLAPQVIEIDVGGWDTHADQQTFVGGTMYNRMDLLAKCVSNLYENLKTGYPADMRNLATVVTISEFGRRVTENGQGGTDHGNGGFMMVLGGRVNGGVYDNLFDPAFTATSSPTALENLKDTEGDVESLMDYRNVFGEIFEVLMDVPDAASVYTQGFTKNYLGIVS